LLFLFDNCALDPERRELRRGPSLLPVEPQVFDVLEYLIRNRDRVVSKDDLLASVWRGRNVSDATLASRINAARRAVGDSGEKQRVIRTVARKGFRFVAAVREVQRPTANVAASSAQTARDERTIPERRHSRPGGRASIAVMPFAATASDGSFADALVHDIISGLARLSALFVIARGSTFALRDQTSNPCEIGCALNVDYAAMGSVAHHGDRLLVTLELCTTEDGRVISTETYEAPVRDALAIQGDIATRIVSSLDAQIEAAERNRAVLKPPNSLNAWEAHHRGLWHMYRFTGPDNAHAQRYFNRAIKLDPTFSRAYAGLSFTHWQNAFLFKSAEREKEADRAFDVANRGLLANQRDPAVHWAMGRALWLRREDTESIRELNQAIALSPNFAIAHYTLGFVQAQTGDPSAAVEAVEVARQLSPFDPMLYAMCAARAWALFRLERFEEAAEWVLKATQQPNAHVHVHALSALVLARAGRTQEALRQSGVVRGLRPGYSIEDFLSSFRPLPEQERTYRAIALRIGIG
jgi:DNA-binding winged helix-turn-helix (wHTH) protein/tetratricopeptide (TPR) repeat protein